MRVSISRTKLFKSCRRAYELKYIEGLEPITSSVALETGKSYHSKLEDLYNKGSFDDSDRSVSSAMAKAYELYIYPQFKVKVAEEWFEYKLNRKHTVIGRVDGVAENGYLVEHKTTGSNLTDYECDLEWDEQIPCYMMAYGVNTMFYTIVKKPTIRMKKGESEEEFYHRMVEWYSEDTDSKIKCITVYRTDEEIAEFKSELIAMCNEMEKAEKSGTMYRNSAYCRRWNTLCEYAQICKHYDPEETYVNYEKRSRHGDKTDKQER